MRQSGRRGAETNHVRHACLTTVAGTAVRFTALVDAADSPPGMSPRGPAAAPAAELDVGRGGGPARCEPAPVGTDRGGAGESVAVDAVVDREGFDISLVELAGRCRQADDHTAARQRVGAGAVDGDMVARPACWSVRTRSSCGNGRSGRAMSDELMRIGRTRGGHARHRRHGHGVVGPANRWRVRTVSRRCSGPTSRTRTATTPTRWRVSCWRSTSRVVVWHERSSVVVWSWWSPR